MMGVEMHEKILGVKAGRIYDIPGFIEAGWPLRRLVGYGGFRDEPHLLDALAIYCQRIGIPMPDTHPRTGMRHICRGWEFTEEPFPMFRPLWGQTREDCPFLPVREVTPLKFPNGLTLLPQGGFVVREGGQPVIERGEDHTDSVFFMVAEGSNQDVSLLPETSTQKTFVNFRAAGAIAVAAVMEDGDRVIFRKSTKRRGCRIIEYVMSEGDVKETAYSEKEYAFKQQM